MEIKKGHIYLDAAPPDVCFSCKHLDMLTLTCQITNKSIGSRETYDSVVDKEAWACRHYEYHNPQHPSK